MPAGRPAAGPLPARNVSLLPVAASWRTTPVVVSAQTVLPWPIACQTPEASSFQPYVESDQSQAVEGHRDAFERLLELGTACGPAPGQLGDSIDDRALPRRGSQHVRRPFDQLRGALLRFAVGPP